MSRLALILTVAALCVFALARSQAAGSVVVQRASVEFSGATPPAGATPWLTVKYDDGGASGAVTVTLEATNLVDTEFVSDLYLNVLSSIDPSDLNFSSPTMKGNFAAPAIYAGPDSFKADGGGYFDIMLVFATSGGAQERFTAGDTVSYVITGVPSLTAASFIANSASRGTGHRFAAHVQGIGQDGRFSGYVTTPEPATLSLLALACLMAVRRRPH
jgi:hypothetical protein